MVTTFTKEEKLKLLAVAQWQMHDVLHDDLIIRDLYDIAKAYAQHGCDCGCNTNYPARLGFCCWGGRYKVLEDSIDSGELIALDVQLFDSIERAAGGCPITVAREDEIEWALNDDTKAWSDRVSAYHQAFIHLVLHWQDDSESTRALMDDCTCLRIAEAALGSDVFDKLVGILVEVVAVMEEPDEEAA